MPGSSLEQGRVRMWINMYPKKAPEKIETASNVGGMIPSKVEIKPRKPKLHQLRLIVWNTYDVPGLEKSGKDEMSDQFVKAFVRGHYEKYNSTDTHWRAMNGEGLFNWRMLFDIPWNSPSTRAVSC